MSTAGAIASLHERPGQGAIAPAECERARARPLEEPPAPLPLERLPNRDRGIAGGREAAKPSAARPDLAPALLAALLCTGRLRGQRSSGRWRRWLHNLCGGIAAATAVGTFVWRPIFAPGLFLGGFAALMHLLLWIFVPRDDA